VPCSARGVACHESRSRKQPAPHNCNERVGDKSSSRRNRSRHRSNVHLMLNSGMMGNNLCAEQVVIFMSMSEMVLITKRVWRHGLHKRQRTRDRT
jgi:hypothetical protein